MDPELSSQSSARYCGCLGVSTWIWLDVGPCEFLVCVTLQQDLVSGTLGGLWVALNLSQLCPLGALTFSSESQPRGCLGMQVRRLMGGTS